jgi:UDP-GlcNAc:undecaprenyl-phosphate GlcNAc-1-phosphate transferase
MEFSYAVYISLSACLMSLVLVPVASSLAKLVGLVDKPTIRKRHVGNVPLAGGMVITLGIWCALPFLP